MIELLCSKNGVGSGANATRLAGEHDLKMRAKTLRKVLSRGGTQYSLPRLSTHKFKPRGLAGVKWHVTHRNT